MILISFSAYSQDSSAMRSGKFIIRMNDWEYITQVIAHNQTYEDMYDSIKNRIRPLSNANYPAGTTLVTVDSITNYELNSLCYAVRTGYNKSTAATADRVITAARLISTYVQYRQDLWDADEKNIFDARRATGKQILRRK